jgi:hypothetical protein
MAPETDAADTNRLATTVALNGAKRPKLTNMALSQRTSTIRSGLET